MVRVGAHHSTLQEETRNGTRGYNYPLEGVGAAVWRRGVFSRRAKTSPGRKTTAATIALLLTFFLALPAAAQSYHEPFRPAYHFTPAKNWTNDPNGLVYFDGEYHLFYQYNPFGDKWGHMSWGHAVSPDMVHWQHLPVAIPEENGIMAFSGSVVVDHRNTSGFGVGKQPPMVAIYTGHRPADGKQAQFLAYSNDRGRTWTRYEANPVLSIEQKEFRDPKVIWYEPRQHWLMVVALPPEHKVRFYSSTDLKTWTLLSEFGPAGATGGVWECPDFFPLQSNGKDKLQHWVLDVDVNPGSVAGGSGGQYFIGSFDGTTFAPYDREPRWQDYGKDFYASVSYSDIPRKDGRRIWQAWMNNWEYADRTPTSPWRGAMTLPRELRLKTIDGKTTLVQAPIRELQDLRERFIHVPPQGIREGAFDLERYDLHGNQLEIEVTFDPHEASEVGLEVLRSENRATRIGYDVRRGEVFVDRSNSGRVDFAPSFPGRHAAPLPRTKGRVSLHIFIDRSSVEVFAGGGRVTITDLVFPDPRADGVALYAIGGKARLVSLQAYELKSALPRAGALSD